MKQELSPEHRVALIQYRFERAYKTLEEADYMRVGNYFNAAINRLLWTPGHGLSLVGWGDTQHLEGDSGDETST